MSSGAGDSDWTCANPLKGFRRPVTLTFSYVAIRVPANRPMLFYRWLKEMMKEFVCQDGTVMRSEHDEELVRALRYHNKKYHMRRTSKDEARKSLKNIAA